MKKILKILGIFLIGLTALLVPLFGVYAATAGSLPGDWNHGIKLNSEILISKLASFTPTTNAYFSLLESQRRYQEVLGLINNDKDAAQAMILFLEKSKQTLFEIQSIADEAKRISYFSQYQTFLANARQNLSYTAEMQKDRLGIDRSASMSTFAIDSFQGEQGKLVTKRQIITTKGINEKEPVSDNLIISNITVLEDAVSELSSLIQK